MMLSKLPDAHLIHSLSKQAEFMNSIAGAAQQTVGMQMNSLAHIEAVVDSMRIAPSFVSGQQTAAASIARFHNEILSTTTSIVAAQQTLQTVTRAFTSLPTYAFEGLRRAQETWLEAVRYSASFAHLQGMLGTNLVQLLREQALYYQSWLNGESDAFTEAFVLCANYLFYRALRILHNVDDARDVVQDTYEKALRMLQTYSIQRIRNLNVRAWLSQIVKTTALNFLRDQHRCEPYEVDWMVQRPGSRFDQPEASLVRQELLQVLYEAFQTLSEIQHKIIFMRYLGAEPSLAEIADYLACPLGTVKSNLSRGLCTLRKRLIEQGLSIIDFEGLIETLSSWPYYVDCLGQKGEVWEE